jgi:hypothetical protein
MNYHIEFLPRARKELLNAWEWYEDRQAGLGDRFLEQVLICTHIIEQHPDRYPERRKKLS